MRFKQLRLSPAIPILAAIALLGMAGRPAQAQTIVSSSPNVIVTVPAPTNVKPGQHQNDTNLTAFYEQQQVIFTGTVDISAPGTYGGTSGSLVPVTPIPISTKVDSFFIYSDPVSTNASDFIGNVTFSTPILGLEVLSSSLNATDAPLGLSTTTYPNTTGNRGLEITNKKSSDTVTISPDGYTLSFDLNTGGSIDEIRVLTAVPEPAMALPLGLMLLTGLVLWRKRPIRQSQIA